MFAKLLACLNRLNPPHASIDQRIWRQTVEATPLLQSLDARSLEELRQMSARFLAEKHFFGGDGLEPTLEMAVRVAALACLPVRNLGYDWLSGIHDLVIYPEAFLVQRQEEDEYGVVHERYEPLSGEAWQHGTLVLAWPEVVESGRMECGYNVVIHEVAHVLDVRNGVFNGFPPLPQAMDARQWSEDFSTAFDELNRQLDAEIEPLIDPYAASSPAEFFAVTSEYHFERPDILHEAFPAVAAQQSRFYDRK